MVCWLCKKDASLVGHHKCMKQWVNGYELSVSVGLSVSVDGKFRAEVALWDRDEKTLDEKWIPPIKEWSTRSITGMADIIISATKFAMEENKGNCKVFYTWIGE